MSGVNAFSEMVKNAWEKARAEAGTDAFGIDEDGNMLYLSEFVKDYMAARMQGKSTALFGDSAESILAYQASLF